jgi:hypothetical protein
MLRAPALSRSLPVLAVVVLLVLAGLTAEYAVQSRSLLLQDAMQQMARLDMALVEQTSRTLQTADVLTRGVIEAVQAARARPPVDADALDDLLSRRAAGVPQISQIAVTDASGRILYTSKPGPPTGLPEVSMPLLKLVRTAAAMPLISKPMRDVDGSWISLLVRPVDDEAGRFTGLAVAFLNLRYFEDFYRSVQLDGSGAITLDRRDGIVIARSPHLDDFMGADVSKAAAFTDVLARRDSGTVDAVSPIDGSPRLMAVRAVPSFPLAVDISVGRADVLAGWRRGAWLLALASLLACIAIGALLLLAARRSREIEQLAADARSERDAAAQTSGLLAAQTAGRDKAEAALRQARRAELNAKVSGGVVAEADSLLGVIVGGIDLIEPSLSQHPPAAARLAVMRAAAELAFAAPHRAARPVADPAQVAAQCLQLLRAAVGPRHRVELRTGPERLPAAIGAADLEALICNLVLDARDRSPAGGLLTIRVHAPAPDGWIVLSVDAEAGRIKGPPGPLLREAAAIAGEAGGELAPQDAAGRTTAGVRLPHAEPPAPDGAPRRTAGAPVTG